MAAGPIALGNFPRALDMSYLFLFRSSGCQKSALLHSPWPEDAPGYHSWTKQASGRLRAERGFTTSSGPIPLLTLSCCTRSGGPGASTACSRWPEPRAGLLPVGECCFSSWRTAEGALHLHLYLRCWSLHSLLILLPVWDSPSSVPLSAGLPSSSLQTAHSDNSSFSFFFSKTGNWEASWAEDSSSSLPLLPPVHSTNGSICAPARSY